MHKKRKATPDLIHDQLAKTSKIKPGDKPSSGHETERDKTSRLERAVFTVQAGVPEAKEIVNEITLHGNDFYPVNNFGSRESILILEQYSIVGMHLVHLYEQICGSTLLNLLILLRVASEPRIVDFDEVLVRKLITGCEKELGGTFEGIDFCELERIIQRIYPKFNNPDLWLRDEESDPELQVAVAKQNAKGQKRSSQTKTKKIKVQPGTKNPAGVQRDIGGNNRAAGKIAEAIRKNAPAMYPDSKVEESEIAPDSFPEYDHDTGLCFNYSPDPGGIITLELLKESGLVHNVLYVLYNWCSDAVFDLDRKEEPLMILVAIVRAASIGIDGMDLKKLVIDLQGRDENELEICLPELLDELQKQIPSFKPNARMITKIKV